MTIKEFEIAVNILISQHRKLYTIKFMRDCCGNSTKWLGLKEIKEDIVDNISHTMNNTGKLFVIKDYKQFDPSSIRRIRRASNKIYAHYITHSVYNTNI